MSVYVHEDCMCGYAKHSTESCQVKDCPKFFDREAKMAQIELDWEQKRILERYKKRLSGAINKDE